MSRKVSASDAKNNFGGLLDSVASLGRVDILKHGRLVAVMLSPHALDALSDVLAGEPAAVNKHMIPADWARRAKILSAPVDFDDD
jgi:prevent-host-death family protein